jgi:hypothetical protein
MVGRRGSSVLILVFCFAAFAATRARAQGLVVTEENYQSIAEVLGAVSIQAPAGVNDRPACEQRGLPCLGSERTPDFGLVLSTAIYATNSVGLVAEVSSYDNQFMSNGSKVMQSNHVRAALAGCRLRTPLIRDRANNFRLFAQIVGGPQWTDVGIHGQVLQPGIGVDTYLHEGLVVHLEYDYRFGPGDDRTFTTGRFVVGIAFPIGSRD